MGKIEPINQNQSLLLALFKKDPFLFENFYFTGGTALSYYYLQHRESLDIDFFSEKKFDPQDVIDIMETWKKKCSAKSINHFSIDNTYIFNFIFKDGSETKVDFVYYPHKQLEKPLVKNNLKIDSLIDISTNKLLTIEQRTEAKDFVDLYFLLGKYTVWDLINGVSVKFNMVFEPLILAADFLKVENFEYLPRMIKPLTLEQLKSFFRKEAKKIARRSVE